MAAESSRAAKLWERGFRAIPLVPHDVTYRVRVNDRDDGYRLELRQGGKTPGVFDGNDWRPALDWQQFAEREPSQGEFIAWASWSSRGEYNIGILAGRIVAVDIDVLDAKIANEIKLLAVRSLGATPFVRVGKAPKTMLLYQIEQPIRKRKVGTFASGGFTNQAVEILGQGQQFAAYGVHPDTREPYRWPERSLEDATLAELPVVTEAQIAGFLAAVREMLDLFGIEAGSLSDGAGDGAANGSDPIADSHRVARA